MAWSLLELFKYDGNFFLQALHQNANIHVYLFLMILVHFNFNCV
jgi:hypothetical protein